MLQSDSQFQTDCLCCLFPCSSQYNLSLKHFLFVRPRQKATLPKDTAVFSLCWNQCVSTTRMSISQLFTVMFLINGFLGQFRIHKNLRKEGVLLLVIDYDYVFYSNNVHNIWAFILDISYRKIKLFSAVPSFIVFVCREEVIVPWIFTLKLGVISYE